MELNVSRLFIVISVNLWEYTQSLAY